MTLEGRAVGGLPAHRMVERASPMCRRTGGCFRGSRSRTTCASAPSSRRRARASPSSSSCVYALFPRLKERREQLAGTLSGGEQQMCAIGRALMSRPKLLLMDEPSAGLAPLVVQQVFDLVHRIRAEGLTVLIVEQNVQQVLEVVDRAYLLEVGSIKLAGTAAELKGNDFIRQSLHGAVVSGAVAAMDIYLLEAIINGILLGGVLALLALGLNLIFGVIDVVWIAYADIVMCGMYAIYWLYAELGWPLPLACAVGDRRRRRRSACWCIS